MLLSVDCELLRYTARSRGFHGKGLVSFVAGTAMEGEGVHLCCSWTGKEKVGFCVREEDRHFVQGEKHVAGH